MKFQQTKHFGRQKKKLNPNQIRELDKALSDLGKNPEMGEQKRADLDHIRVYKFRMSGQICLLAYSYSYSQEQDILLIHAVGPHENFYRDLKKTMG